MMRPDPRAIMPRPKTWHARSVPVRLVSRMAFQSASSTSSVGVRLVRPAQLIRMSTRPSRRRRPVRALRATRGRRRRPAGERSDAHALRSSAATSSTSSARRPVAHDVGPGVGQAERHGLADAGRAAHDDCRQPVECDPSHRSVNCVCCRVTTSGRASALSASPKRSNQLTSTRRPAFVARICARQGGRRARSCARRGGRSARSCARQGGRSVDHRARLSRRMQTRRIRPLALSGYPFGERS